MCLKETLKKMRASLSVTKENESIYEKRVVVLHKDKIKETLFRWFVHVPQSWGMIGSQMTEQQGLEAGPNNYGLRQ